MRVSLALVCVLLLCSVEGYSQRLRDSLLFSDPVALSLAINSQYEESMPVFTKDSSKLYFVRTFHPDNSGGKDGDQDIWVSTKREDGLWTTATNVEGLNNHENNGAFGITDEGDHIYLLNAYLKRKRTFEKGVAIASKKKGEWEHHPETLPIPDLNIKGDFYGFHVNANENVLIISNKGQGSLGEEDLYVSLKDSTSGEWGSPIHMGPKINTKGFEMSPYLSPDTDTLYFSSNGHGGFGEADIFYSVREDHTWQKWSDPVNLGPQINSPMFDAYFIRSENDVYWSSNRNGEMSDIYTAKVVGWVWPPLPPKLDTSMIDTVFVNAEPGELVVVKPMLTRFDTVTMDDRGDTLVITVPRDTIFYIQMPNASPIDTNLAHMPNGTPRVDTVYVQSPDGTPPRVDTVYIESPNGDPIKVTPGSMDFEILETVIYFDLDKYYLTFDSRMILNRVDKILKKYPDWYIRMEGHCDIRDSDPYNMWLSDKRIESAKGYLNKAGINMSRMNTGYYGETQLAVNTPSVSSPEDDHHQNRRVTIRFASTSQQVKQMEQSNPMPNIPKNPVHGSTTGPNGEPYEAPISSTVPTKSINESENIAGLVEGRVGKIDESSVEGGVEYKVQLFSTDKDIAFDDDRFNGLEDVDRYKHQGLLKYTAGKFASEADAVKYRSKALEAGFSGVFVVKLVDGVRQ